MSATVQAADLLQLISNAYGVYHCSDCPTPLLDFEDDCFTFQPDHGPEWKIPMDQFQEAVDTYAQEYCVKAFSAVCYALRVENWHKHNNGTFFYSI